MAGSAGTGGDGGSAGTAGSGGSAGTGGDGGSGGSAGTGGDGGSGGSAGTGGSGGSGGSGGDGGSAGTGGSGGSGGSGGDGGSAGTGGDGGSGGSAGSGGATSHFIAYGDTRTNANQHQEIVDAFAARNPEFVLHSGDLWDGYTSGSTQWKSILTKNGNIATLLANNLFLVSQGNHETSSEVLGFSPTIVRGNSLTYSATIGNTFVVSLGYDPSSKASFLGQELAKPEASAAAWRFVFAHVPIYSSGEHGANGVPAIESLCDQYGVALYFSGHDHIYERTHQIKAQSVADTGNALQVAKGTVYIVTGGGGAPLYSVNPISVSHTAESVRHYIDLVATSTLLTVKVLGSAGENIDSFTVSR